MSVTQQKTVPNLRLWPFVLKKFFNKVGLVLITAHTKQGPWKVGKTDLGLFIAENLLNYGFVSEVATNINTEGYFPQISDLITLKQWLHKDGKRKLYILDEINIHAPRRRAMSNKNVGILSIFPEISKARARLICIGQDLFEADKQFIKQTWCHGIFLKKSLKSVQVISHMIPNNIVFKNLPRTSIPFDPYESAPFTEKPTGQIIFKDEELQLLWQWAEEKQTWKELGFDHPMKFNRFIRKQIKKLLVYKQSHIPTIKR